MKEGVQGKNLSISVLRILATLAVVFLHTNSGILDRPDLFPLQGIQRDFLVLTKQYVNWAAPVFLMLTGTLLLRKEKQISFRECITRYAKRIVLALFFFGIIFSMMEIFLESRKIYIGMVFDAAVRVLSGKSWAHLWYLYMLLGVYCALPILKRYTDAAPRTELRSILIMLFIVQTVIPVFEMMTGISIAFEIPVAAGTVFYLFLGKYLGDGLPGLFRNKKNAALYLVFACVLAACAYFFTHDENLIEHFAPVYAVLVFSLFQNVAVPDRLHPIIWKLDRLCFGVYLVHPLFINFTYKVIKITPFSFGCYGLMIVLFFLFFAICAFCASLIMSKIPFMKKHVL